MPRRSPRRLAAARAQDRSPRDRGFDWLARALGRLGALPAGEIEQAIRSGRVRVNGQVQREPLAAMREGDRVEVDGRRISLEATTRVVMLHKPRGVVSAGRDPEDIGTVFEALRSVLPNSLASFTWHAVGRLDRNTTGLLLFTNDEEVVAHVTSPKTHLPKRYVAHVSGQLSEEKLAPLREGLRLDDGATRPAKARIRSPGVVELVLTEGRYHQVKRMLGRVGLPVLALHREAIGSVELDVPEGSARLLSETEITKGLGFKPRERAGRSP